MPSKAPFRHDFLFWLLIIQDKRLEIRQSFRLSWSEKQNKRTIFFMISPCSLHGKNRSKKNSWSKQKTLNVNKEIKVFLALNCTLLEVFFWRDLWQDFCHNKAWRYVWNWRVFYAPWRSTSHFSCQLVKPQARSLEVADLWLRRKKCRHLDLQCCCLLFIIISASSLLASWLSISSWWQTCSQRVRCFFSRLEEKKNLQLWASGSEFQSTPSVSSIWQWFTRFNRSKKVSFFGICWSFLK